MADIGQTGIQLLGTERDWDPRFGPSTIEIYEGEEDALNVQAALFRKNGVRAMVRPHEGPIYRMRVYWPDGRDGRNIFVEHWAIITEWAQVDLRNNTKIIALAGDEEILADWHNQIRRALLNGRKLPAGQDPNKLQLYRLMARGTEAYEIKRPVLRRKRVFPPKYGSVQVVRAIEVVYTTASLVGLYAVPPVIASKLPADPPPESTPSESVWGWKLRLDNTESVLAGRFGKSEETLDWVYSAWSTLLYDVETATAPS